MAYDQYTVSTNGTISYHATAVTDEAANNLADYEGAAALNLTAEHAEFLGQSFWVQDAVMVRCGASLNIASMAFKPETFGTAWGITAATGSTLEGTPVTATHYILDTGFTSLPKGQWLTSVERTSDSGKFQILVYSGRITGDFNINFTQGEYIVHDTSITAFLDSNNDLINIIRELSGA